MLWKRLLAFVRGAAVFSLMFAGALAVLIACGSVIAWTIPPLDFIAPFARTGLVIGAFFGLLYACSEEAVR